MMLNNKESSGIKESSELNSYCVIVEINISVNNIFNLMDYCIECKIEKVKTILRCGVCDDKLNIRIQNMIREKWNYPFARNENYLKPETRNHN